jgi:hypothetical protein
MVQLSKSLDDHFNRILRSLSTGSLEGRRVHGSCQICFQVQRPCTGKTEKTYGICINWYTAEFWAGCLNRNNNKINQ